MKARDVKIGQLIKTEYGLATVMRFFAPKSIGCVLVTSFYRPGNSSKENGSTFRVLILIKRRL